MLALRTPEGIDLEAYRRRHGCDLPSANRSLCAELEADGLISIEAGRLRPTPGGLAIAEGLGAAFELRPTSPASAA